MTTSQQQQNGIIALDLNPMRLPLGNQLIDAYKANEIKLKYAYYGFIRTAYFCRGQVLADGIAKIRKHEQKILNRNETDSVESFFTYVIRKKTQSKKKRLMQLEEVIQRREEIKREIEAIASDVISIEPEQLAAKQAVSNQLDAQILSIQQSVTRYKMSITMFQLLSQELVHGNEINVEAWTDVFCSGYSKRLLKRPIFYTADVPSPNICLNVDEIPKKRTFEGLKTIGDKELCPPKRRKLDSLDMEEQLRYQGEMDSLRETVKELKAKNAKLLTENEDHKSKVQNMENQMEKNQIKEMNLSLNRTKQIDCLEKEVKELKARNAVLLAENDKHRTLQESIKRMIEENSQRKGNAEHERNMDDAGSTVSDDTSHSSNSSTQSNGNLDGFIVDDSVSEDADHLDETLSLLKGDMDGDDDEDNNLDQDSQSVHQLVPQRRHRMNDRNTNHNKRIS